MKEPRGQELIKRYKKNYHIPAGTKVTESMILKHWDLERRLTRELLDSDPQNRWGVFERCYTQLYSELEWLNESADVDVRLSPLELYRNWLYLVGSPPKRIYEIGSGKGEMISFLASRDFECKASEITRERGEQFVSEKPNLSWCISDGVYLERFEAPNSYDVVISSQVIEHLHPDDLLNHFKGVLFILSSGGRYIFNTPHKYKGPSDVSKVFKCDKPRGTHLKEYTYGEIKELLEQAGFEDVRAVFYIPPKIVHLIRLDIRPKASRAYLNLFCSVEWLILLVPWQAARRRLTYLAGATLFRPSIFVVAQKRYEKE